MQRLTLPQRKHADDKHYIDRLAKAKTRLILNPKHVFFGAVAMNMPHEVDERVPTAATSGEWVKYNPAFMDMLTDDELLFLVAHECLHPMLEHMTREGSRDHDKWNQACDYVINYLLVEEAVGSMPKMGLYDKALYAQGGGTSEGIYAVMPPPEEGGEDGEDGEGGEGQGPRLDSQGRGALDDVVQASSGAKASELEGRWKVAVAQAAQAAKMVGSLSANMARMVDEILKPKVDWREVLRRFIERVRTDERTFSRPNRRYYTQGLYLPSVSGEQMGELAFAIDCSGSIGPRELNQFAAEIRNVKQEGNPIKLHIIYFDSEVCHYDEFTRDDEVSVQPHGGGGTAFSPVFRYMEKHGIEPIATVFLTDLYCGDFGPEPGHPVLWVSTVADQPAPWGEVITMKDME